MFIITSRLYISYMEPLFVVAKIIGSPGKNDGLLSFSFKIVVDVIVTTTVLLRLATHE